MIRSCEVPVSLNDGPMQRLLENHPTAACLSLDSVRTSIDATLQTMLPPPPPAIVDHGYEWRQHGGDWGYLHSLDGNVYHTSKLQAFLTTLDFDSPNMLEVAMVGRANEFPPRMLCYERSPLISIPHKRVQQVFTGNRNFGGDHVELNRRYINGYRIDIGCMSSLDNRTTHVPMGYVFSNAELNFA